MPNTPVQNGPAPNGDEKFDFGGVRYIGNFHKSLKHNGFGEVDPGQYQDFLAICADHNGDFEQVGQGPLVPPPPQTMPNPVPAMVAQLISPQAGRATEALGPNPDQVEMLPPPSVLSYSAAAEMTELYWMSVLRDTSLDLLLDADKSAEFIEDIRVAYQAALDNDHSAGATRLGTDLPVDAAGGLDLSP